VNFSFVDMKTPRNVARRNGRFAGLMENGGEALKLTCSIFRCTVIALLSVFAVGCAQVPLQDSAASDAAKRFSEPTEGMAGLYIYRDSSFGGALKKDIWIDNECLGESAPNTFFYTLVSGDEPHTLSTESEFSPNNLSITPASGENYFIRQYIKMGVFVGGANLEEVEPEKGKLAVLKLNLAKSGSCSR